MLLEETTSGNLRLYSPANVNDAVRFTRADIQATADVFALLDSWARDADTQTSATGDARSSASSDLRVERGEP